MLIPTSWLKLAADVNKSTFAVKNARQLNAGVTVSFRIAVSMSVHVEPLLLISWYCCVLTALKIALFSPPSWSGKNAIPSVHIQMTPLLSTQMSPCLCVPDGGPAAVAAARVIGTPVPVPWNQ